MSDSSEGIVIKLELQKEEVEAVFPDAVMTASEEISGEEPLKSLGPASLIPVLVKAIQEQQTMIETLQAQVAELQGAS